MRQPWHALGCSAKEEEEEEEEDDDDDDDATALFCSCSPFSLMSIRRVM
jgi:hypothetical protein